DQGEKAARLRGQAGGKKIAVVPEPPGALANALDGIGVELAEAFGPLGKDQGDGRRRDAGALGHAADGDALGFRFHMCLRRAEGDGRLSGAYQPRTSHSMSAAASCNRRLSVRARPGPDIQAQEWASRQIRSRAAARWTKRMVDLSSF